MDLKFPDTIKYIHIYNASYGTRELDSAMLCAIRSVHPQPWNVELVEDYYLDRDDVLYIMICPAGLMTDMDKSVTIDDITPIYYISWQLESFVAGNKNEKTEIYQKYLSKSLYVWDYCIDNIKIFRNKYNVETIYVPVGYTETIASADIVHESYVYNDEGKDVDILFLGYSKDYPRRVKIRDKLFNDGFRIWFVSDLNLEEMQAAIRRSKVCINILCKDSFPLTTIRLNILLSNMACVLSEIPFGKRAFNMYKNGGVVFTEYDKLIEKCQELVNDFEKRRSIAVKSHQWYKNNSRWTDIVDFNRLLPTI